MKPDRDGFTRDSAALVAEAVRGARLSSGGWWNAKCPFCRDRVGSPDRHGKFGLNAESSVYYCFRCGVKGSLRPREAAEMEARHKAAVSRGEVAPENPHSAPDGFWPLAHGDGVSAEVLSGAREYLARRRVGAEVIRDAGLGACVSGKYAGRVIVPVYPHGPPSTKRGPWEGFVARAWDADNPVKYLYPGGMPRGRTLYNAQALGYETDEPVLVVEGAFDTFPFWPLGAVALLGEASHEQVRALAAARRPVCVALDGDAWRKGVALAQRLRLEGARAGAVILPPRTDPDEVARALREARWDCIEQGEVTL